MRSALSRNVPIKRSNGALHGFRVNLYDAQKNARSDADAAALFPSFQCPRRNAEAVFKIGGTFRNFLPDCFYALRRELSDGNGVASVYSCVVSV